MIPRPRVLAFSLLVDLIIRAIREDRAEVVMQGHDMLDKIDPIPPGEYASAQQERASWHPSLRPSSMSSR